MLSYFFFLLFFLYLVSSALHKFLPSFFFFLLLVIFLAFTSAFLINTLLFSFLFFITSKKSPHCSFSRTPLLFLYIFPLLHSLLRVYCFGKFLEGKHLISVDAGEGGKNSAFVLLCHSNAMRVSFHSNLQILEHLNKESDGL